MSRTLPTGYAARTEAPVFGAVFLLELEWPGGTVRVWNGYGTFSWDSKTWTGTGDYGRIGPVGESRDLRANGVTLELSGIPSAVIDDVFANDAQGKAARIWLGELGNDGAFTVDPLKVFDGFIDNGSFRDSGATSTVTVQLEKELINRRVDGRRYTHEDQQIDAAGDRFFEYVPWLAANPLVFGPIVAPVGATPGTVVAGGNPGGGSGSAHVGGPVGNAPTVQPWMLY
jgi:hypothetical protein